MEQLVGFAWDAWSGLVDWGLADWIDQGLEARRGFRVRVPGRFYGGSSGGGDGWLLGIFGGLIALFGVFAAASPRSFIGEPQDISLSLAGIASFIVRFILSCFPEGLQVAVVRILGVIVLAAGGTMVWAATGSGDLSAVFTPSSPAAKRAAALEELVREKGPAMTAETAALIRTARPDWIVDDSEPLRIVLVDRENMLPLTYQVEKLLDEGLDAQQAADQIIEEFPRVVEDLMKELPPDARESYHAETREKYASQLNPTATPAAPPSAVVAAAQSAPPPIERADEFLKQASAAWQKGDYHGAVQYATYARNIRAAHLGTSHEKVQEVEKMIAAAQAKITGR